MATSYSASGSGPLGSGVNTASRDTPLNYGQDSGLGFQGGTTDPTSISFGFTYLYTERLGKAAEIVGVSSPTNYAPSEFKLRMGVPMVDKQTPFREEVRMLLGAVPADPNLYTPQMLQYMELSKKRDDKGIAALHASLVAGYSEKDRLDFKRQAMISFINKLHPNRGRPGQPDFNETQMSIFNTAKIKPDEFNNYKQANIKKRSLIQSGENYIKAGALFLPYLAERTADFIKTRLHFGLLNKTAQEQESAPYFGNFYDGDNAAPKHRRIGPKENDYRLNRDAARRGTLAGFSLAASYILLPWIDKSSMHGLSVKKLNNDQTRKQYILK